MGQLPLGIGIIGAGNIIRSHATALRSWPELSRLVAVADLDARRAEAAKKRYGFDDACDDYRRLLDRDDIDVVSVCTPPNVHGQMVRDALQAGKHVVCEKPMAANLADADAIIQAADQHPKQTVSFVFQLRSDPTIRRMKRSIEYVGVGRMLAATVHLRVRKTAKYYTSAPGRGSWGVDGGGVLINQAVHQLDTLVWLLGEPLETSAVMDTFVQPCEAEDTIAGWVKFRSGVLATIECTTCAQGRSFAIELLSEHASLGVSGDPEASRFQWRAEAQSKTVRRALRDAGREQNSTSGPRRRGWMASKQTGHAAYLYEFLMAVRAGLPGPVPPREARRSLELTAGIYESALTRRVVSFPMDRTSPVYGGVDSETIGVGSLEVAATQS